jgi:hypothetical protein
MITSDRRFWPLFWTQFVSALNDNVFKNALVILVTFENATVWGLGKAQVVALSGGLFILPFFLFSPFAGQIADRMEKSRLVRLTKLWEVLIMLVACVGFVVHAFGLLLIVLFLAGVQAALFGPVKYSLLPDLVRPEELVEANAYVEVGTFLAILLGTIAGSKLVRLPAGEWVVCVVLMALALLGVLFGWFVQKVRARAPDLALNWNPVPTFRELLTILREKSSLFHSVLGISWFWFFGAAILSVLPVFVSDYLHANEDVLTCFLAMFTVGIGVGNLLCGRLSFRRLELGLVPIGALGLSLFLGDLYFAPAVVAGPSHLTLPEFWQMSGGPRLFVDFFLMSVAGGFFILPLYTLLQERSRPEQRSRVIAANNIMNAVYMVVASILVMVLNALHLSYPQIFLIFAALNLLVTGFMFMAVPEFMQRLRAWLRERIFR